MEQSKIVNSTEPVYITRQRGNPEKEKVTASQPPIFPTGLKKKAIEGAAALSSTPLLPIASEIDFPKVRIYLESITRNSRNSKATYETGLKHFQRFLVGSTTTKASERKRRGFLCSETENLCVLSS